eukprot:TRINITY_DN2505_c0_g1_i5.p1 TRINITY_DN2505_c0_g1~~TRINITY_DN2505_c0_g1_i5.p1  ORF type:complete len:442 (+),score=131.62 TRINITY_DN2505_c0_g1_i5:2317-3642(+)
MLRKKFDPLGFFLCTVFLFEIEAMQVEGGGQDGGDGGVGTNKYGLSANMFTRGDLTDFEQRGESMVEKHHAKLQSEKEHAAMEKLQALMPSLGTMVKALALQESLWDVDAAAALLRKFQVACADDLGTIQKKRKKRQEEQELQEEQLERKKQQKIEEETQAVKNLKEKLPLSPDQSDDQAETDSSDEDRDRSKHKKHKKRRSNEKDKKKSKRSKKHRHKKNKKRKMETGGKEEIEEKVFNKDIQIHEDEAHEDAVEFGKYGIIRETDIFSKKSEFTLWALEEKNTDVESMPKFEEKELFREYMEDYNTGTLPHKKYYDLELYERNLHDMRSKEGGSGSAAAAGSGQGADEREKMLFNDEEERRREKLMERAIQKQERLREAYNELKYTDKARDMREQQMLRMQMSLAYRTGDMNKAQKLAERLRPDDLKEQRRTSFDAGEG